MRLRKQDNVGDMQFGRGNYDFWYNQPEAVAQLIATRLLMYQGEWFLDSAEGMPWGGFPISPQSVDQGQVLGSHTQLTRDIAIRVHVLGTEGVRSIDSYNSDGNPDLRNFNAQMVVTTLYGRAQLLIEPSSWRPYFVLNWSALNSADPL